jgi:hypothetical protein
VPGNAAQRHGQFLLTRGFGRVRVRNTRPHCGQRKAPRRVLPAGQVHVDQSPAECIGAGFVKSREGWPGRLLWGLPNSAFPGVPRRRMPWAAARIAKVRFFDNSGH